MWYVSISSLFLSLSSSSRGGFDVVIDGGKSSFASLLRFDRAADLTTTRVRRKRAELLLALMPFEQRAKGARAAKEIVVIVLILLSRC